MFSIWCVLSAILFVEAVLSLRKTIRFRQFFRREFSRPHSEEGFWPSVALLAPCKGFEENLRENIQSWFSQDYSGQYKIFFIVESETDPAVEILKEFSQGDLLIAGKALDCGQKVHNLLYAIKEIPSSYESFLFVDADCLLKPDWMRNLVECIKRNPEDAATGYRWFRCQKNFGSLLRAVWNSSILTLNEEDGKKNFAWGGSTAIARSTFEACKITDFWKGSVSDDYSLTLALQSKGRSVRFVPGAIIQTADCIGTVSFLKWAFRQLLITRIYYGQLWFFALLFHLAWLFWIFSGLFYLPYFLPVFLIVQSIQAWKADLRWQCVPIGNRLWFWLTGPLVGLCNSALLIGTLFTRKIVWRGVEYHLLGKNELKIIEERTEDNPR